MQSRDGDPIVPANHLIVNARSRFRDLKRLLTDVKLPTSLRLRPPVPPWFQLSRAAANRERYATECAGKTNATCSMKLSKITGGEIANEARMLAVDVLLRARDLRWNWRGTF